MAGTAFVAAAGWMAFEWFKPHRYSSAVREQVAQLVEADRDDLALRHLGQYLDEHPDDVPMLHLQARLMAERVSSENQMLAAARVHERLLRLDPNGPEADEVRKRLASIYIRYSDAYRATLAYLGAPDLAPSELRYSAATKIVEELTQRRPDDAEAHRLLGMASEGLAVPGDPKALQRAIASYERALELDPTDETTAERLANLYRDRLEDDAAGERVLDQLVDARPGDVEPRLVRYRYFRQARRESQARRELEAALEIDPQNPRVRLSAAEAALRRGNTAAARVHMEAIQQEREDRQEGAGSLDVLLLSGLIEFAQEHPQEAMEQWRRGLRLVGGTNAELSWWLAYVLIRLGRIDEAELLVNQYRRHVPEDDPALGFLRALRDEQSGRPDKAARFLERALPQADGQLREEMALTLGRCYEALGNEEEALTTYRLIARNRPGSALPQLASARLLLRARPEAAIEELQAALRDSPEDPELLTALAKVRMREQALRPASSRRWTDFDRALEAALEVAPESVDLGLLSADRQVLAGRLDQAETILQQLRDRAPRDPRPWVALAEVRLRQARPEAALETLDRADDPDAAGDDSSIRLTRSRVLLAQGQGRKARAGLVEGIDRLSIDQQAELYAALGRLLIGQGDTQAAREALNAWAATRPRDPEPILARLRLAVDDGDLAEARQLVERLGTIGDEEDLSYRLGLALLYLRAAAEEPSRALDLLTQAEQIATQVLQAAPELEDAYLIRARVRHRRALVQNARDRLADAVNDYRAAWERGAQDALPPLIDLLLKLERFDELRRLPRPVPDGSVEQVSALALLGAGQTERAAELLQEVASGAETPEALRLEALELAGRYDEVEARLRSQAENADSDELAPWVEWLRALVRFNRPLQVRAQVVRQALARIRIDEGRRNLLEARLRRAAADWVNADRAFEAALEARPEDPETLIAASDYYAKTDRRQQAIALLERLLAIEPENRPAARQLAVTLAEGSADPEVLSQARALVEPAAEAGDPEDRLALAIVLSRSEDPAELDRAVGLLERTLEDLAPAHPSAVRARSTLARLLLERGEFDRAARLASTSAGLGTGFQSAALKAQALIAAERFAEAELALDRLALAQPGNPTEAQLRVRLVVARAEAASQNPGQALDQAVVDRGRGASAIALGRAAFALLETEQPEAADRIGRHLADLDPALSWMPAQRLARQGNAAEALSVAKVAAENASDPIDRSQAGRVVLEALEHPEVPEDSSLQRQAAAILETALEADPDSPNLLFMLALVRHRQGRYEEEVRLYRRILELWPADRPETALVQNNLAWALSEGLGRPEEALPMIEDVIERSGGANPTFLGTRGVILARLERLDDAIDDLERAVRADPDPNPRRLLHLALAYREAGLDDQYRARLEQAREAGLGPKTIDPTEREALESLPSL